MIPHAANTIQGNRHRAERLKIASIIPRLCHRWESLPLKERLQRLLLQQELALRKTSWTSLSQQEKAAMIDALAIKGYGIQIQAVCTAKLKLPEVGELIPYGLVRPGEVCGLGFPGQLWRAYSSRMCTERHPSTEYICDFDWKRLLMEVKNPASYISC